MGIYFEEKGTKAAPTIVFIHGAFDSIRSFTNQVEHFNDYHCIFIDLPEHGKSRDIKPFEESTEYVSEIIKSKANGGRAHVFGHSYGGIVVSRLMGAYPELIDHAIIGSTNMRKTLTFNFFASYIGSKYFWFKNKEWMMNDNITLDFVRRIFNDIEKNFTIPEVFYKLDIPTLLISGEREQNCFIKSNRNLLKVLKNSRGVIIRNGRHHYHRDNHVVFNHLVRSWINDEDIENKNVILM